MDKSTDTGKIANAIINGDRVKLAKAITWVESKRSDHQRLAQQILDKCMPHTGNSIRLGVTGSPGVGKSTFIESFGSWLIEQGRKPAVLAIDPSSYLTKGSILGDKTRMSRLSADERAFIRPSPSGEMTGGVAHKTREVMLLCEAAGYDTLIIETLGVGQSEISVHAMVDFFLLLIQPGSGDELQGIKRGIVEMADLLAVTKADGEQLELAERTRKEYANALHLFPPKLNEWVPRTLTCSGIRGDGMHEIWQAVLSFHSTTSENGWFFKNRQTQLRNWMFEIIGRELLHRFSNHKKVRELLPELEKALADGNTTASKGAMDLLEVFFNNKS